MAHDCATMAADNEGPHIGNTKKAVAVALFLMYLNYLVATVLSYKKKDTDVSPSQNN
jgi:hypothetical protein